MVRLGRKDTLRILEILQHLWNPDVQTIAEDIIHTTLEIGI